MLGVKIGQNFTAAPPNFLFSVGNQIFIYNFYTATHGGVKNQNFKLIFLTGWLSYWPRKG
jgi:hypothetical protein